MCPPSNSSHLWLTYGLIQSLSMVSKGMCVRNMVIIFNKEILELGSASSSTYEILLKYSSCAQDKVPFTCISLFLFVKLRSAVQPPCVNRALLRLKLCEGSQQRGKSVQGRFGYKKGPHNV